MNYTPPGDIYTTNYGAGGYMIFLGSDVNEAWTTVRNFLYEEDFMYNGVLSLFLTVI